jgi:hypothetical protein
MDSSPLRQKGYSDRERLRKWLDEGFPTVWRIDSAADLGRSVEVDDSILGVSRSTDPNSRIGRLLLADMAVDDIRPL